MDVLIIDDPSGTRRFEVTSDVTTIGRSSENDVQISDSLASRFHCQIEKTSEGFKLVDLESQNGTCVNGKKVNSRKLGPDDSVEIGKVSIRIVCEEDDKDAPSLRPLRRKRSRRVSRRKRIKLPATDDDLDGRFANLLMEIRKELGDEGLQRAEAMFRDFLEDEEGGQLQALTSYRAKLERLVEVNKALNSELDLKRLLNRIMDNSVLLTNAERGFIVLLTDGELKIEVARNFDKESVKRPEFKISHSIAEKVASSGEGLIASDAQDDERFEEFMSVSDLSLRSVLCMPLKIHTTVVGVLYMDNRFLSGVFTDEDKRILASFADQAAVAIENARLHQENLRRQGELSKAKERLEELNRLLEQKVEVQEIELVRTRETLERSQKEFTSKYNYDNIVGSSKPLQAIFKLLDRITDSDVSVLVHGRSGTGKELVARAIHFNGPRQKNDFVSINCAAISETLLESELFGHVRGAFTGAVSNKKGLFEVAHEGTLFLDEIGEMSQAMQKKLLRALQEGEIRPVGGKDTRRVDVRILSASNTDLKVLVERHQFREDLFYRLNVIAVHLPDLKERKEDIPLLVDHFLTTLARDAKGEKLQITREALRLLVNYPWPGNVRELENEMRRVQALSEGVVEPDSLSENIRRCRPTGMSDHDLERPLKDTVRESVERIESDIISRALTSTGWKKTETARLLGISRPTLDAKISQYGLTKPR